jgi:hypothetical protein
MKKSLPVLLAVLLLAGCTGVRISDLEDEEFPSVSVIRQTQAPSGQPAQTNPPAAATLEDKMALLSFTQISGNYARACTQDACRSQSFSSR